MQKGDFGDDRNAQVSIVPTLLFFITKLIYVTNIHLIFLVLPPLHNEHIQTGNIIGLHHHQLLTKFYFS